MVRRLCAADGCSKALPKGRQKWCSDTCGERMNKRKYRARRRQADGRPDRFGVKPTEKRRTGNRVGPDESLDGRGTARRGEDYFRLYLKSPWPDLVASGAVTHRQAAEALGTTATNISRWSAAYEIDKANDAILESWRIDVDDQAAVDEGYEAFTRRFHPDAEIPDVHLEWETELDEVVGRAGRLLLLAPQRHGKTEFLIRYCQRRITRDPDICILWVGRNLDAAKEAVGLLRQYLEDDDYAEAVLGPGETFKPRNRQGSWTDEKFTVAQRQRKRKSPTVRALGLGGTVSGRDADLIIIDDPQEREDVDSPPTNNKQHRWFFSTFLSRKMKHTGIAFITSRKGPSDIPGRIIEDRTDDDDPSRWRVITYQAHDPGCVEPERDYDKHVDCLLWPNAPHIDWKFLAGQKFGDELWFQCNYQNDPSTERLTLVTRENIKDATVEVRAGHFPPGWRLIGGFDPATAKPTAAVLWAYHPRKQQAQIVTAKKFSVGTAGFNEAINEWHARFMCVEWVWETGGGNNAFIQDTVVQASVRNLGIRTHQHYSDRSNKVDSAGGVTSMIQQIRNGQILFPTLLDDEDGEGVRQLIGQILNYDADYVARSKHADDDLVMAMWFPWWKKIQKLIGSGAEVVEVVSDFNDTGYASTPYGAYTGV